MRNEQLWALLSEYPQKSSRITRGKNLFQDISQGRVFVCLKKVYILDQKNIPRRMAEKELEAMLSRLFYMRIIGCDRDGRVSFTNEYEDIKWLKQLLNFQNI